MRKIYFDYWTNLRHCMGDNAGGSTYIDVDEQEEDAFYDALDPAYESGDMLAYFKEHLPEALSKKICDSIKEDFLRVMAADEIANIGIDAFPGMTEEEFSEMSGEELVDRLIEESNLSDDEDDYIIVDIEVNED